ncbi:MAG: hypothetical protein IPP77_09790 [Bacteroidetes bacterium]|nr:hypothetical protein [Bacteroidota bacterium]
MKQNKFKSWLLATFLILLWAPIVQDNLHIFKGGALKGAYTLPDNVNFDFKIWFTRDYADKKDEYLSSCFGFRPDFVRLHNQLKYWAFKLASSNNVIIGKENYLYEQHYIDEYFGTSFIGEEKIVQNVRDLKELQDSLSVRGIFMFTFFAPGKGSFYPEFIPNRAVKPKQPNTNYSAYISTCQKAGINYVDCKAWFMAMKDTSRYRLFPKGGVHWSYYGDMLAFDSLVHYVEGKTGKDLPDLKLDSIQVRFTPMKRDYDAGDGLNLIFPLFKDTLAYPHYSVNWKDKDQMASLTIADSYYWEMYMSLAPQVFSEVNFWYYFNDFVSKNGHTANKHDMKDFICQHQVVCLMYTDAGLANFGSGFIQSALYQFKEKR